MIIGSISEDKDLEKRISITPDLAKKYISNGFGVLIESNFGSHLGILDEKFLKEGCKIEKKENILKQHYQWDKSPIFFIFLRKSSKN